MKRVLTALIGFPLVLLLIFLCNKQVVCFAIMLVAIISMYEYLTVIEKICKPIKWVGYLSTIVVFLVSILQITVLKTLILYLIPIIILILFLHIILTDMKYTFKDVAFTLFGIAYVTGFITFLSLMAVERKGSFVLLYTMFVAWATDVLAFWTGKYAKNTHNFTKISPKKTIEGCIGGTIGGIVVGLIYMFALSKTGVYEINGISYLYIGIINMVLSIVSQIGDLAASSIKRLADAKDYGNLLPGHGGMLDRIDGLIFVAPFVYFITNLINII